MTKHHTPPTDPTHPWRERLPDYATAVALGLDAQGGYDDIIAHLAECAECQVDLGDLLELALPAYAAQVAPAPARPRADLAFLGVLPAPQPAPHWLAEAGRLVIQFSDALLAAMRQPALAGAARGQLLYRYIQEPGSVHDLDVSIEVYAEGAQPGQGRVRIGVDVPSRGALDQTGSLVVLRAGDSTWQGETDEMGCVDFAPVPLDALPRLRVEIVPPAS